MEIITGYFVSRQQAFDASEYLRKKGFKGEITVMGRNNEEEDIDKTENLIDNTDNVTGVYNYQNTLGFGGVPIGLAAFMAQGSGQLFSGIPMFGIFDATSDGAIDGVLKRWGVPGSIGDEIKSVINSGNSVILVNCEVNEKQFISDSLQYKGAQNIN